MHVLELVACGMGNELCVPADVGKLTEVFGEAWLYAHVLVFVKTETVVIRKFFSLFLICAWIFNHKQVALSV